MQTNQCAKINHNAVPLCTDAESASRLSKAMGNRHRLLILFLLLDQELAVGSLNARIGLSPSGCSQHLAVLKREGLVQSRRDATHIYYSLQDNCKRRLISWLYEIYGRTDYQRPRDRPWSDSGNWFVRGDPATVSKRTC